MDKEFVGVRPRGVAGVSLPLDIVAGPFRLTGARLSYQRGLFVVGFDGTVTAGPLTLDMSGLGLEISVDPDVSVAPTLQGLGASFVRTSPTRIEVQAALMRLLAPRDGFAGALGVEVQNLLSLQALVIWERIQGWDSIFAYAELRRELGLFTVPPVVFTGVAFGFGINSVVRRPSIDEVASFPLLGRLDTSGEPQTPSDALTSLTGGNDAWVRPSVGDFWVAGGVSFSVFKFIETKAVVVVSAGAGGWSALLSGRTTLDLPRPKRGTTIARIIIDFKIDYDSRLERFALDVQIAPGSYVLDPRAQLRGGMALYVWGKTTSTQARGFVLTVGGYHPRFAVPAHFPRPPRMGFDFKLGPVAIVGSAYAALTDNAFMVGGRLEASFDQGGSFRLQAWLTAHLDALVQWKPFKYDIEIGVRVGVAATVKIWFVRVRISLEVGATLHLYGPPLGGRAEVKLWFVTFTFPIGSPRQAPVPVPWDEFRLQLEQPLQITLDRGRLLDMDASEARLRADAKLPVAVSSDGFRVLLRTAIPASLTQINAATHGSVSDTVGLRPMSRYGVSTQWTIRVQQNGQDIGLTGWGVDVRKEGVPNALWGEPPAGSADQQLNAPQQRSDRVTAAVLTAPPIRRGDALPEIRSSVLSVTGTQQAALPPLTAPSGLPSPSTSDGSPSTIASSIASETTKAARSALLSSFGGLLPGSFDPMTQYATRAKQMLTEPPLVLG